MKLLGGLVAALVLLLPAPARAQSVKAADLVGRWTGGFIQDTTISMTITIKDTIIFRPDSTYSWRSMNGGKGKFTRWTALSGDTLWFGPQKAGSGYKVTIKDQRLLLSAFQSNIALAWIFQRTDSSTPKP